VVTLLVVSDDNNVGLGLSGSRGGCSSGSTSLSETSNTGGTAVDAATDSAAAADEEDDENDDSNGDCCCITQDVGVSAVTCSVAGLALALRAQSASSTATLVAASIAVRVAVGLHVLARALHQVDVLSVISKHL